MNPLEKELYLIEEEEFTAAAAKREGKKRALRVMLLDTTDMMVQRPDAHRAGTDCGSPTGSTCRGLLALGPARRLGHLHRHATTHVANLLC